MIHPQFHSQEQTGPRNRQWLYQQRPQERVGREHYALNACPLPRQLLPQQVVLAVHWFSVDPYMRIQQAARSTWEAPHPLGVVQGGGVVGQVIACGKQCRFQVGDWAYAYSGWQEYPVLHESELQPLDPSQVAVETALGVLGMPGRTAWFGLMEVGRPKPGDQVVVSAAAGAVGSLVVQFAKRAGARVIAISGSQEKSTYLREELGADQVLNYRDYRDWRDLSDTLLRLGGVDVYFDNVGGMVSDAVLAAINLRARIIVCGQISQYDGGLDQPPLGPRLLQHLLFQRASIQGILARDYTPRMAEYLRVATPWVQSGELRYRHHIIEGFERLPEALAALSQGANFGKLLVKAQPSLGPGDLRIHSPAAVDGSRHE